MTKTKVSLLVWLIVSSLQTLATQPQSRIDCAALLNSLVSPQITMESRDQSKNLISFFTSLFRRKPVETIASDSIKLNSVEQLMELSDLPIDPDANLPSLAQLQAIWTAVSVHPVAALCNLPKYDPTMKIGFCFGRAMAAHLEAMVQGVDELNIKKIFIVGQFTSPVEGEDHWDYHVTTAIRSVDGLWYAIDPRLEGPVLIEQWGKYWMSFGTSISFLVNHAQQLFPTGSRYVGYEHFRDPSQFPEASIDRQTSEYLRALVQNYLDLIADLAQ